MKKRVISMLLAAVMTVSLVGGTMMTAAAEEAAEFDSLDDVTEETLHETLNETEAAAE